MNSTEPRRFFTLPAGVERPALEQAARRAAPPCPGCSGVGWLVPDLPSTDPRFGKAVRCPQCAPATLAAACGLNDRELELAVADIRGKGGAALRAVAQDVIARPAGWLTLWGAWGTAKTLLAQVVVAELVRRGVESLFAHAHQIEQSWFADKDGDTNYANRYRSVRVLVFDEMDKTNLRSEWVRQHFQDLLDHRYRSAVAGQSLTIFTLNGHPDAMLQEAGDILSRMNDGRFTRPAVPGLPAAWTATRWGERILLPILHLDGPDARPYIKPEFLAANQAAADA